MSKCGYCGQPAGSDSPCWVCSPKVMSSDCSDGTEEVVSSVVDVPTDGACQSCKRVGPTIIVNEQQDLPWGEHSADLRELRLCETCAAIHRMNLDSAWHDFYSGIT